MSTRSITRLGCSALAAVPAFALIGASAFAGSAPVNPDRDSPATLASASVQKPYINYSAPQFEDPSSPDQKVGGPARLTKTDSNQDMLARAQSVDRKYSQGNPTAARQLAALESQSIRTGESPKDIKANRYKKAGSTQEAKLLTILVEFNDEANDDFTNVMVPDGFGSSTCVPGTVQNGPKSNRIPDPATSSLPDNNSMWVKDFSPEHYNKMLYSKEGITERVRPDLTGPDGKPGIDISGYTMKNMYEEMSKGAYTVTGAATPWVTVPRSEAYYGATVCQKGADGTWSYGAVQDMQGHPDNPLGPGQLPIDAVAALAKAQPEFPWSEYDLEDLGDRDGDGDLNEPDGIIDHVVLVHAGKDKSGGGGAEGPYGIWAHSSAVADGAPVPGTNLRLSNYIVQPEDSGVGVFAHEYGHDLGLPDLYDTGSGGDSDVDFWDLMSSGSHAGPIFQSMPTHMGIWGKWVLGWAEPDQMKPGDAARTVRVGQTSRTPKGSADGVKIDLPDKSVTLAEPHSGTKMWYSSADQSWAKNALTRDVTIPNGATDARFWSWNNAIIEKDWDFGFLEVSTDGGSSWAQLKQFNEAGQEVTTSDGYGDPNGRLKDFGKRKYGLTGATEGWERFFADLTPYAGQTVKLRFFYATDAAFEERGWFLDDLALTVGEETVWSDDAETNDGWTPEVDSWTDTTGAGWVLDTGSNTYAQYYLVEWRNLDGFDQGLKYTYDTTYQKLGPNGGWKVEKIRYNAPGALVWYRDTALGNVNHVLNNLTTLPSEGAKGGLLIVDSNFEPLRRKGANAANDPSTLKNLPSRPQSSNAAFNLVGTYPFTECTTKPDFTGEACDTFGAQPPVRAFTDTKTWYPGIEVRGEEFFYRDADASVVVPSVGNAPYSTRVVGADGKPLPDYYGQDIGLVTPLGTGNPADDGVAYGTSVEVVRSTQRDQSAHLRITPPPKR